MRRALILLVGVSLLAGPAVAHTAEPTGAVRARSGEAERTESIDAVHPAPAVAQPAEPIGAVNTPPSATHATTPNAASQQVEDAPQRPRAKLERPAQVFTAYAQLGGLIYLSRFQTAGGVGGGVGLRDTWYGRYFFQADLHHLVEIGSAFAIRLGAGIQRASYDDQGNDRLWTPGVLLTGTIHMGDRLRFLTFEHPTPIVAPAVALGVAVAPLRFQLRQAEVSLLEVGAGLGWDFPGLGTAVNVSVIEVGGRF